MNIATCTVEDVELWARLRALLWPEQSAEEHGEELMGWFTAGNNREIAFLARLDSGEAVGFAEAAVRADYVNGCETSPVVFLEGIYVLPEHRRKGLARLLCAAVENWGRRSGCAEMASDALLENTQSHLFHAALGFTETERVVFFRRTL